MMAMQAASLEALEKANVGTALISALAYVFDYELAARRSDVATKQDLGDVRAEISTLRSEMKDLRSEMKDEMKDFRSGVKDEMKDMRHGLELKIASTSSNLSRQLYLTVLGQMGLLLGIAYFFVTHVK